MLLLLLKALTRTPLSLLHAYARLVDFVAFHIVRWRRPYVERDIANAFPQLDASARAAILRQSYRNAADVLFEALWGFGASADALRAHVVVENPEVVERCVKADRSVVLLTAHFANWEWLLLASGVHFDIPIDVVYQEQRVNRFNAFLRDARSRFGSTLIPREDFVYTLMAHAGQARAYALIADQTPRPDDPKMWTRFMHQDTAFFLGAGKIAKFLEAEVLYVGMRRIRRGYYSVRLTVLAEPPYEELEDSLVVQRYAAALEQQILESPGDWLWLQKKWKYGKPPAEDDGARRQPAAHRSSIADGP